MEVARTNLLSLADLRDAGTLYSLGMALSVLCNDRPTVFDKTAPVDERIRQYEARRASVPAGEYCPFSARGFTDGVDGHVPTMEPTGCAAQYPLRRRLRSGTALLVGHPAVGLLACR